MNSILFSPDIAVTTDLLILAGMRCARSGNNPSGPARGFGCTVSGALLIQLYAVFLSQFGYKVSCFSWILDIQFIDMN